MGIVEEELMHLLVQSCDKPNVYLLWHQLGEPEVDTGSLQMKILFQSGVVHVGEKKVAFLTGLEDPWSSLATRENQATAIQPSSSCWRSFNLSDVIDLFSASTGWDAFVSLEAPINVLSFCKDLPRFIGSVPFRKLDDHLVSMLGSVSMARIIDGKRPPFVISQYWRLAGIANPLQQTDCQFIRPPFRFKSSSNHHHHLSTIFVSLSSLDQMPFALPHYSASSSNNDHVTQDPFSRILFSGQDESAAGNKNNNLQQQSKRIKIQIPPRGYVCKICQSRDHYISDCPEKHNAGAKEKKPESCWFCLANPGVDTSLVMHVGDFLYLSMTKGPLNEFHFLIIPIQHMASTIKLPSEWHKEIDFYHRAILSIYKKETGTDGYILQAECAGSSFEKFHMNILVIVLPLELAEAPIVISTIAESDYFFKKLDNEAQLSAVSSKGFFKVSQIFAADSSPHSPSSSSFLLYCPPDKYMDFALIRKILCRDILKEPRKENWRNCIEDQPIVDARMERYRSILTAD